MGPSSRKSGAWSGNGFQTRPTGLGALIDKDHPDDTIYSGDWAVSRMETKSSPLSEEGTKIRVDPLDAPCPFRSLAG